MDSAIVDESDTTPIADASRKGYVVADPPGSADSTLSPQRAENDLESNRLSFSSFYNIGSAIYDKARAMTSGPSSVAESDSDLKEREEGTTSSTLR